MLNHSIKTKVLNSHDPDHAKTLGDARIESALRKDFASLNQIYLTVADFLVLVSAKFCNLSGIFLSTLSIKQGLKRNK